MGAVIPIDDPDDPRIAAYRDVRERDLVGRRGLFIAEGEVVLRVLARQRRHAAVSVLVASKRAAALAEVLSGFDPGVPVFAAEQAVMDALVGFPIHRGILALGRRAPAPSAGEALDALGSRAVVLALFGIANHDNMGGILRNAAAFGAGLVLLDETCCDPLYRKAIRVSVGGALLVPFTRLAAGEDAVALLQARGFEVLGLSPGGGETLAAVKRPERVAVALGAEGPGLPQNVLARARRVAIPMAGGFDSLNVATTSGIVLHHLMGG
ncbi:MAG TPA: RNA methyltransferase [Caulobacteraceae bacterium]|nr:RNA methyltransferase [Caulobacteraceae bacterium]